jgi:glycosyltransferase involved in cell wall biosynthesis
MEHEVWLLTRENNGPAIEAALSREPALRMHPVYVDLPATMRWWKRGRFGLHLYYFLWQWLAWRVGSTLHAREGFGVAHHLTFAVDWMPAGVGWVPGVPFVWGPVGGTTSDLPFALWRKIGWRGLLAEAARGSVTRPSRVLFGDRTARRAALVLAQNEDVAKRFSGAASVAIEPNVALHPLEPSVPGAQRSALGRRAVFVGRLLPFKGLRLAVAALARPEGQRWSLDVFGEGPDERSARVLARRLGVHDRIRFLGQRPRSEVLRAFCEADALLFPSLHEGAGWAVGEAVALGCPEGVAQQVDSPRTVEAAEPHLQAAGAPGVGRADQ